MEKKIITFVVILFIACSAWLFSVSSDYLDPDKDKSWWSVYFSDPKSTNNLDFIIESHSNANNFSWIILEDRTPIENNEMNIPKGEKNKVEFNIPENSEIKKYTIEVYSGEEKKQIYKNL